jgi:hypothetical protein
MLDFHSRRLPFDSSEWWLSGRVLSILNTPTETDAVAAMALLKAP